MTSISIHIIANQSSYHDDESTLQCFICAFCPQLIRNVRSRRRVDSSSIIAHPVNSDLHTWEILLKCYAKNSTYICIYISMTLLIIDMNFFLYQFNLGLIVPLFTVSVHEKKEKKNIFFYKFRKLAGVWLLGEVVMLRFMDLRWPRLFRRSSVGLATFLTKYFVLPYSIDKALDHCFHSSRVNICHMLFVFLWNEYHTKLGK